MNVSPVVIDDDDVVMITNDDIKSSKSNQDASTIEDTIILDEERTPTKESTVTNSDKDSSFARLLRNNSLMNKIVHQCLNMKNNAGMSRVINKTLLPLYSDTVHKFKESEQFTEVLKSNLKKLRNDPDYKFLHLKSLCEELKSGIYRKRVPFVTLSKDLKGDKRKKSSLEQQSDNNKRPKFQKQCNNKKTKSTRKETDIINLDNSDEEQVIALDDDDVSVVNDSGNNDKMIVDETANSDVGSEQSNKENSIDVEENCKTPNTITPSKDLVPKSNSKPSNIDNCDLLVAKKAVQPDQHSLDYKKCVAIEQQIALYQEKILKLEEEEVTTNLASSPYIQCDQYKAKIVQLYKRLCKITGNGDGNLLKQRVVRLQVAEGHPPGPVKRLERFLNSTIDVTGVVSLPDLPDVVRCVTESNIVDRLGWNQQEIMREALGLFTQCCQALRKSRQKREYKDLMSLVRDKSVDDYDPANEDPNLCAKLEENKIIAKANEEEILEKFVKMEYLPKRSQILNPRLGNMLRIKDAEYTDTASDSELEPTLARKYKKYVVPTKEKAHETAKSRTEISCNIGESKMYITNEQPSSTDKTQDNFVNINCIQNAIDSILKKALTTIPDRDSIPTARTQINTINITTRNTTNITIQNLNKPLVSNPSNVTQNSSNINVQNRADTINFITNQTDSSENITSTTIQKSSSNPTQIQRSQSLPNTLQKIGKSNVYVVSFESKDNSEQNDLCSDVKLEKRDDLKAIEKNTSEQTDVRIKTEDVTVKQEPIDINSLLSSLGDNYISTIFDIEDPFLVVEISSDSSDDEL